MNALRKSGGPRRGDFAAKQVTVVGLLLTAVSCRAKVGVAAKLTVAERPEAILDDGSVLSRNATNCGRLGRAYGANSDDWLGKEVELSVGTVDYQGQPTETILVKPISPPLEKKAPVKRKKRGNARDDLNDEIAF